MAVGTLEEIIDDNHAIVSTSVGSEHYVTIMSFVDKDQLEPGCTVLLNHKVNDWLSFFDKDDKNIYLCHNYLGPCCYWCVRWWCWSYGCCDETWKSTKRNVKRETQLFKFIFVLRI